MKLDRSHRVLPTIALMIFTLAGCTAWQSPGVPGLDTWKDERVIVKKAKNDPFPTPQQVGLK